MRSLYEPASQPGLTQQQRWELDTELLNEVAMKADAQSPVAGLFTTCEVYRLGIAAGNAVPPPAIRQLAAEWCAPAREVVPEDCARLEGRESD